MSARDLASFRRENVIAVVMAIGRGVNLLQQKYRVTVVTFSREK